MIYQAESDVRRTGWLSEISLLTSLASGILTESTLPRQNPPFADCSKRSGYTTAIAVSVFNIVTQLKSGEQ